MKLYTVLISTLVVIARRSHGFATNSRGSLGPRSFLNLDAPAVSRIHAKGYGRQKSTAVGVSIVAGDTSTNSVTQFVARAMRRLENTWKSVRSDPVWHWRIMFGSFFSSLFIFRQYLDSHVLVNFWGFLLHSQALPARIFRADSWEWMWAISCFGVYIHAFGWADRLVRKSDEAGQVHPWKKYRLQDRYQADQQRRRRLESPNENKQVQGTDVDHNSLVKPKHSKWNWQAWLVEFWVYAAPLLAWDILAPRRHGKLGAFGPPTTMGILGRITGALLMYDMCFFCGHWLMHKIPWLYRTVHSKHHITKEVRACEIVRLSIPEEVLEVGFSIVALNVLGVHPIARTIYNAIITFLLTELHCGFDFPWTPQNVIPFGLATGSRRHHYHHRIGKHYYQKFFHHVDRLFGCFQKDDGSLDGDSVRADAYIPPSWRRPVHGV